MCRASSLAIVREDTSMMISFDETNSVCTEATMPMNGSDSSLGLKFVRFGSVTEYPNLDEPRNILEVTHCWYSTGEIELFRHEHSKVAARFLGLKQHRHPAAPTARWALRMRLRDSNSRNDILAQRCKSVLSQAYQECTKVRTEQDYETGCSNVDRSKIRSMYRDTEDLVGLECVVLQGLRDGGCKEPPQVRRILDTVAQRTKGDPHMRDQWMCLMSRYTSLPSRVFAREMGLAQQSATAENHKKKRFSF